MANVKVTALTALTAADSAATDVLPIVDVSADATKKLAISDLHRSVPDGTLSAPGIAFQSDLNSGLYRSGTDAIALVTNGAARILINANGDVTIPNDLTVSENVGIGTSSASSKLHVEDALAGGQVLVASSGTNSVEKYGTLGTVHYTNAEEPALGLAVQSNSNDNNVLIGGALGEFNAATNIRFYTAPNNTTTTGTERARIDSSGRLLVGTSTAQGNSLLQVEGDSSSGAAQGSLSLRRGLNTAAIGGNVGADLGKITFGGNDGTVAATIRSQSDAAWSSTSDCPGRLTFSTTADGESSPTERMRIDNAGDVTVKTAKKGVFSDGTFTLANDATTTFDIGYAAFFVLTVTNCSEVTNGTSGAFFANSASSTIAEISDPFGDFTANNNVANTTGVTKTTNSSTITIRNDYGASATYRVAIFGTSSS